MKRLLAVLCQISALVALATHAENWCQRFPEDAILVGYVNVKGVRAIPQIEALLDGQDRLSRMATAARKQMAVDLETVTDVWFGVSPTNGPLAVLHGDYNLTTIRGVAGTAQSLRVSAPAGAEFALAETNPNRGTMVAFLSPREAVVGRAAQVEAFLANRVAEKQHPRHQDLAGFDAPTHLVQCALLAFPQGKRLLPAAIAEQIALLTLAIDGTDSADLLLTIQPSRPEMAAPLGTWCQSTLELLRLLPPEHLALLNETQRALLDSAQASAVPQGVAIRANLPLVLIQGHLGRKLGSAHPTDPPP